MLPSHSSALKLSTVPPRPVSVNSSARIPSASTAASECPSAAYPRTLRSTTTAIPVHHDTIASSPPSVVVPTPDESLSPLDADMEMVVMDDPQTPRSPSRPELHFENLPVEIHEAILDHLFGERASMSTTTAAGKLSAGSWSKALRHPRRKALSNLSLIARVWRPLVQERIYRHSRPYLSYFCFSVIRILADLGTRRAWLQSRSRVRSTVCLNAPRGSAIMLISRRTCAMSKSGCPSGAIA